MKWSSCRDRFWLAAWGSEVFSITGDRISGRSRLEWCQRVTDYTIVDEDKLTRNLEGQLQFWNKSGHPGASQHFMRFKLAECKQRVNEYRVLLS